MCETRAFLVWTVVSTALVNGSAVTHLHGSATVSPYDGWAEDTQITDECKDYFYPNNDARALWYHDHAIGKHCAQLLIPLACNQATVQLSTCCSCTQHQCACKLTLQCCAHRLPQLAVLCISSLA
jgi:hypothetical protein